MFEIDPAEVSKEDIETLSVMADAMNVDEDSALGEFLQELVSMLNDGLEAVIYIHFKE